MVVVPWLSKIPFMMDGFTYLFWTFVDHPGPWQPDFVQHEYRHVVQSVLCTLLGLAFALVFGSLIWIPVAFLWFWALYLIAWILAGFRYSRNWFEMDANRYAKRRRN